MTLESVDMVIRWLGGLVALSTLGVLFYGIRRGMHRDVGRVTGNASRPLRSSLFYVIASAFFFGLAYAGWIPLPWVISPRIRIWMLVCGSLLYFPGLAFLLWARLTLGKHYFVSTALGAQLFADHQLVRTGPYAIVRHPMYVGLAFAAWGGLLIYFTWTTVYFVVFAPMLAARALREEQALSAEFGEQWQEYCRQVSAFIPKLRK